MLVHPNSSIGGVRMDERSTVSQIEDCLARHAQGDAAAWNELITHTFQRLLAQTNRILKQELSKPNPLITENVVLAETYFRLRKAMQNDKVGPMSARDFFGLAARNIRWQIHDMVRKPAYFQEDESTLDRLTRERDVAAEVIDLEQWRIFWKEVEALPPDQREVFDLLWINGLSQYEAADVLNTTRNQVDSVWRAVKAKIAASCRDFFDRDAPK